MVDLPPEIWFNAIEFIPDYELKKLISVNSAFLEAGMNRKWQRTTIYMCSAAEMPILKRMSDPFVAERVKLLRIHLHFNTPRNPRPNDPTFEDCMDALLEAVPLLRNAYDFKFAFQYFPSSFDMKQWIQSLCHSLAPNSGNVQALALAGSSEDLQAFTESMPPLSQLQDLKINFLNTCDDYTDVPASAHHLASPIVYFINGISLNLRSLEIWCGYDVNLSEIFKNLIGMPTLHNLDIQLSRFAPLCEPSELFCFLERCSDSLRNLELRLAQDTLDHWFSDIRVDASENHFLLNLHSLSIVTSVRTRAVDIITQFLQKTSTTLQKLDLQKTNLYEFISTPMFNDEELSRIVDAAAHCIQLQYLRVRIECLNDHVLDMLASKFPALQTFSVTAESIPIIGLRGGTLVSDEVYIMPNGKVYQQWKFRNIRITRYYANRISYTALVDKILAIE
ncbi:hypothetical protein CPC08DRAFT_748873 [Agrocybe pediades]|nr:hypothetical protein CPC08DRAFT_748873 [Agrocybe pediades]